MGYSLKLCRKKEVIKNSVNWFTVMNVRWFLCVPGFCSYRLYKDTLITVHKCHYSAHMSSQCTNVTTVYKHHHSAQMSLQCTHVITVHKCHHSVQTSSQCTNAITVHKFFSTGEDPDVCISHML
ncbi:hypothetical protein BsWGS_11103 [Bradybaena similaris]